MPYDLQPALRRPSGAGLRAAVVELISRGGAGEPHDEQALRAALRVLVATTRRPAAALHDAYGGARHDPRGRIFANHTD
jgi:hypothetical protein